MSSKACLALLLDGPMQSWGHASRFLHRTTALHPTRSGVFGMIAAAMGLDKGAENEAAQLAGLETLMFTTMSLPRRNTGGEELPMSRLEDYHTVAFTREEGANAARTSKLIEKANKPITARDRGSEIKPTYRHYLLDARFGVLLEGPLALLEEVAGALANPRWGIWLGRKCCLPASPVLVCAPGDRSAVWQKLLQTAGYSGNEPMEAFDHVVETAPGADGSDMIEDAPIGYGRAIGERHAARWVRRVPRSSSAMPPPDHGAL